MGATSGSAAVCLGGAGVGAAATAGVAGAAGATGSATLRCCLLLLLLDLPRGRRRPFRPAVATEHADHLNRAVENKQQAHAYHQGAAAIGEEAPDQAGRRLVAGTFFVARTFNRAAFTRCGLCGAPRGGDEVRLAGDLRGRLALDRGECGFRGGNALGGRARTPSAAGFERRISREVRIDRRTLGALHMHERRSACRHGGRGLPRRNGLQRACLRHRRWFGGLHRRRIDLRHLHRCLRLGLRRRRIGLRRIGLRRRMGAGFDRRETLHQPLERIVHGLERLVGALLAFDMRDVERFEIALERAHIRARSGHRVRHVGRDLARHALGGGDRLLARLAHLQGELLDAALDRAQVAGLVIRRIELVRDVQDLPFDMLECGLIARRGVRND